MSAAIIADGRLVVGGQTYRYLPLSTVLSDTEVATTPYAIRVLIENVARRAPAALPAILGTVAGDDTLLVVAAERIGGAKVAKQLSELAGL